VLPQLRFRSHMLSVRLTPWPMRRYGCDHWQRGAATSRRAAFKGGYLRRSVAQGCIEARWPAVCGVHRSVGAAKWVHIGHCALLGVNTVSHVPYTTPGAATTISPDADKHVRAASSDKQACLAHIRELLKLKLTLERPGGASEVMGLESPPLSVYDL